MIEEQNREQVSKNPSSKDIDTMTSSVNVSEEQPQAEKDTATLKEDVQHVEPTMKTLDPSTLSPDIKAKIAKDIGVDPSYFNKKPENLEEPVEIPITSENIKRISEDEIPDDIKADVYKKFNEEVAKRKAAKKDGEDSSSTAETSKDENVVEIKPEITELSELPPDMVEKMTPESRKLYDDLMKKRAEDGKNWMPLKPENIQENIDGNMLPPAIRDALSNAGITFDENGNFNATKEQMNTFASEINKIPVSNDGSIKVTEIKPEEAPEELKSSEVKTEEAAEEISADPTFDELDHDGDGVVDVEAKVVE